MLGNLRRAVQVRMLETRRKKLQQRRDLIIASLMHDGDSLYRHEYPNTPVLEDVFMELDYLEERLAGYTGAAVEASASYATH